MGLLWYYSKKLSKVWTVFFQWQKIKMLLNFVKLKEMVTSSSVIWLVYSQGLKFQPGQEQNAKAKIIFFLRDLEQILGVYLWGGAHTF